LKFTGTQQGMENSRMYNEMVVLKLVQSMTKLITSPPEVFRDQIHEHFRKKGEFFHKRIKTWMELSSEADTSQVKPFDGEFATMKK
jgi:ubiquitin-conjugating enzyme E2 O